MIQINKSLYLQPILNNNATQLFELMNIIYTDAYRHFWKDDGEWYLNAQYSKENIERELNETKAAYYFVVFEDEIIGNFRIVWDDKLVGLSLDRQVKLHRLYLHSKTQGKGIGKQLFAWLKDQATQKNYEVIWVDAMNEKQQAFEFYKKLGFKYHSHTFLNFDLMLDEVREMSQLYLEI